jgi:acetylornithine/LysW-gamma-L-lysine aminotransferase
MGARMMDGFKAIESPLIREVRGMGLIVAIELKQPSASYLAQLAEKGVLALNAGSTVMRFLPPLVIGAEDVDTVVEKVAEVLPVD